MSQRIGYNGELKSREIWIHLENCDVTVVRVPEHLYERLVFEAYKRCSILYCHKKLRYLAKAAMVLHEIYDVSNTILKTVPRWKITRLDKRFSIFLWNPKIYYCVQKGQPNPMSCVTLRNKLACSLQSC
jgi:hypothetical protein